MAKELCHLILLNLYSSSPQSTKSVDSYFPTLFCQNFPLTSHLRLQGHDSTSGLNTEGKNPIMWWSRGIKNSSAPTVLVTQSYPSLCDFMDYSLTVSSVHGILQARIPECVVIPFSRESSQRRDWTQVSCIADRFFTIWATRETLVYPLQMYKHLSLFPS